MAASTPRAANAPESSPDATRRMAESARHLVDEVFGPRPVRQWVLSFPYPLRFLFASKPDAIGPVLGIVHRVIASWLADQAGVDRASAQCGAVTLIQRFGSALNLNIHFHMLWLDGVYDANVEPPRRKPRLRRARAPTSAQLTQLANTIAHRVCRHPRPLREARRAGASALPARSARAAAGRVTRCRPHSRQPSQSPIRCGHDPAGLRSALCRDSVRNGYALSRCVAPRCRKPTHEPPICARSVPKAALAWPLPTRQTRQKGRLNFLYP